MAKTSSRVLDALGTLARLGLAAVWLVSGAVKISDTGQTFIAVKAYDVLPSGLVEPVATAMPLLELLLGVLLLIGVGTRWVAGASGLLLLVLIAAIVQSWARGLTIDCGCFGGGGQISADQTQYPQEIARDTGFFLLALWLMIRPRTLFSLDGWLGKGSAGKGSVGNESGNSAAPADDYSDEKAASL